MRANSKKHARSQISKDATRPYTQREAGSCQAAGSPGRLPWISEPGHCLSFWSSQGPLGVWEMQGKVPPPCWEMPELSVSGKRFFKWWAWVSVSQIRLLLPPPPWSWCWHFRMDTGFSARLLLATWFYISLAHFTECGTYNRLSLFLSSILY